MIKVEEEAERVRDAMLPLCEPLHDAFTTAEAERRARLPMLDLPIYKWLHTHTIRGLAHFELSTKKLGPWSLYGNHGMNGELWLTDNNYRIRILHGLSDEQVPPPGTNGERRAFYANIPLIQQGPLWGPPNDRLLVLWRIAPKTGAPSFRVVRTIGAWKFGSKEKTDLDFALPKTAEDLATLQFIPTDDDLELQIPAEEGGVEDAGGISG
ncbi:hypothetical protein GCM10009530_64150 [Microbispora corallina]|uniref:Uncharacterized protein n=1 Tax=Microbispora corallina TaxID=83302 RepID=A0ABQ4GCJ5_9ACTN|nr:hypothetical protein [Microbispora corallina]GIH44783.1 hypothetical protein Mco01_77830 [Microbispora corallina]